MKISQLPDGKYLVSHNNEDVIADNHLVALQTRDAFLEQHAVPDSETIFPNPEDWDYDHANE